jgi:hypothetical protein
MKRTSVLAALAGLTLLTSGCISDQYWTMRPSESAQTAGAADPILILQIRERPPGSERYQSYWDERDFLAVQGWLESESQASPIVVFVHGWHHNARKNDQNLQSFRDFVGELQDNICSLAQQKREINGCVPVKAVFVGWRGDSSALPNLLDFWTIFGRHRASTDLGTGKLRGFIAYLQERFPDRTMIIAGHSLGANALYNAIKPANPEHPLVVGENTDFILMNPAISSSDFQDLDKALRKTIQSDLQRTATVDSLRLSATTRIIQERKFRKITIIQADGDSAVGFLFKFVGGTSIGFDEARWTHSATANSISVCPSIQISAKPNPCHIALDSGLTLTPKGAITEPNCSAQYAQPSWVITADPTVSKSHGDIWNKAEQCALAELIGKRVKHVEGF